MSQDNLFSFIKTLTKAEKRKFKLFASKSDTGSLNLYVRLFDTLDSLKEYNEVLILKKNKLIKPSQLPNLKIHLYKIILTCLRLIEKEKFKSIEIREEIDYAKILYNKGLYKQSLKILEKTKIICEQYNEHVLLFEIIEFEKNIELRHITGSSFEKASVLINESEKLSQKVSQESRLTSLCLNMYAAYLKNGFIQNKKDATKMSIEFKKHTIHFQEQNFDFLEKIYFYQSYTWYSYIQQDFLKYYRYAQKWANCYNDFNYQSNGFQIEDFLKSKHHLFNALFFLSNGQRLEEEINVFEKTIRSSELLNTFNLQSQFFVDFYFAKINLTFLKGNFNSAVLIVPEIEEGLEKYKHQLDKHKILIFYYKIAAIYFGNKNYEKCIDYLNRIINLNIGEIRIDLQCFSRMLHLVAHFELENYSIIDYLIKSLYRFLLKYKNNTQSMLLIINFLKEAIKLDVKKVTPLFKKLLNDLKECLKNPYEKRTFLYLDLISYLESHIQQKNIDQIIAEKYLKKINRF